MDCHENPNGFSRNDGVVGVTLQIPTPTQRVASLAKQKPPPHGRGLKKLAILAK